MYTQLIRNRVKQNIGETQAGKQKDRKINSKENMKATIVEDEKGPRYGMH